MDKHTVTVSAAIDVEVSFKSRGSVAKDRRIAKHINNYIRSSIKAMPKDSTLIDTIPWRETIAGDVVEVYSQKPKIKVTFA